MSDGQKEGSDGQKDKDEENDEIIDSEMEDTSDLIIFHGNSDPNIGDKTSSTSTPVRKDGGGENQTPGSLLRNKFIGQNEKGTGKLSESKKKEERNSGNEPKQKRLKSKKRKAEDPLDLDGSFTEEKINEMTEALTKVSNELNSLYGKICDFPKARKDIREQMDEIHKMNELLLKETVIKNLEKGKENLKKLLKKGSPEALEEVEEEKEKEGDRPEESTSVKQFCARCAVLIENEEKDKKMIIEKIKEASSLNEDDYSILVNKKWPQEVFEKTKIVPGNPLNTKCEQLIVFYENIKEDSTLLRMVKEKFPDVEEVLEEEKEEGKMSFLENIINTSKGSKKTRIYFSGIEGDIEMRKRLMECKLQMEKSGSNSLAVAVTQSKGREY
ncbi:hypothetical protein M8J76_012103, partial [Diaphorina citri]